MLVGGPCAGWDTVDVLHNRISMHSCSFDDDDEVDFIDFFLCFSRWLLSPFQTNWTNISTKGSAAFEIFTLSRAPSGYLENFIFHLHSNDKSNRNTEPKCEQTAVSNNHEAQVFAAGAVVGVVVGSASVFTRELIIHPLSYIIPFGRFAVANYNFPKEPLFHFARPRILGIVLLLSLESFFASKKKLKLFCFRSRSLILHIVF
jgi:hypothetical protein